VSNVLPTTSPREEYEETGAASENGIEEQSGAAEAILQRTVVSPTRASIAGDLVDNCIRKDSVRVKSQPYPDYPVETVDQKETDAKNKDIQVSPDGAVDTH